MIPEKTLDTLAYFLADSDNKCIWNENEVKVIIMALFIEHNKREPDKKETNEYISRLMSRCYALNYIKEKGVELHDGSLLR